MLLLMSELAIW